MRRSCRPNGSWVVMVDDPSWEKPRRVKWFLPGQEQEARLEASRLNWSGRNGALYFVEHYSTSDVLDVERCNY